MELDLFDPEIDMSYRLAEMAVNLNVFRDKENDTNEALKKLSRKIDLDAKPIFDYFFEKHLIPVNEMPQYYCSPFWAGATGNFKWRYTIIVNEGTFFLVFLRLVGIMYHQQYFSLPYRILSSDCSASSVIPVVGVLRQMSCIKTYERISLDTDLKNCDNANFYVERADVGVMTHNRRNKYRRAMTLCSMGVEIIHYERQDMARAAMDAGRLYEEFRSHRFAFNARSAQNLLVMALNRRDCFVYGFYFRERLIGIQIATCDFRRCVYVHFAKDITALPLDVIRTYADASEDEARRLKNFLGTLEEETLKTQILVNYNYDALFVDGFIADNPDPMVTHKSGYYPKQILYKIERI